MITAKIEDGHMVIRVPVNLENPPLSKTRKSRMVYCSNGFTTLEGVDCNGKPVQISINCITTLDAKLLPERYRR